MEPRADGTTAEGLRRCERTRIGTSSLEAITFISFMDKLRDGSRGQSKFIAAMLCA